MSPYGTLHTFKRSPSALFLLPATERKNKTGCAESAGNNFVNCNNEYFFRRRICNGSAAHDKTAHSGLR